VADGALWGRAAALQPADEAAIAHSDGRSGNISLKSRLSFLLSSESGLSDFFLLESGSCRRKRKMMTSRLRRYAKGRDQIYIYISNSLKSLIFVTTCGKSWGS
jgi:hypothetical protein